MSEVIIDQMGRVEIPQSIRELLGLKPGQLLSLETDPVAGSIQLRPLSDDSAISARPARESRLSEENGFLVIEGGEGLDIAYQIDQDREDRMRKLTKGTTT